MTYLLLGLLLFIGIHSISLINEGWRNQAVVRLGLLAWKGIYSIVALTGLILMVYGYRQSRVGAEVLYVSADWLTLFSLLLMIPVFPLLLAAYLPGRIQSAGGHPMLIATIIWAGSHLLVNGRSADVILFGTLLVWAVADLISMARRPSRSIPAAPPSPANDLIAIVVGLALYLAMVFWLHPILFGVKVY